MTLSLLVSMLWVGSLTDSKMVLLNLARKIRETGIAIVTAIANEVVATTNQLAQVLIKFFNGMASAIRTNAPGLTGSIRNLASAMMGLILDGLSGGMLGEDTVQDLLDIGKKIMDGIWDGLQRQMGGC